VNLHRHLLIENLKMLIDHSQKRRRLHRRSYKFHFGRLTRLNFLAHLFLIRRIHLESFLPIRRHQIRLVPLDYYCEDLGLHLDHHL
jgi:hypothetical protein